MSEFSQARLEAKILESISSLIVSGAIKNHNLSTLTSVTRVELAADNASAKVFVSSLYDDGRLDKSVKALNQASAFIQSRLSAVMRTKNTPGVDPYDMYDKMNDGKAFEDVLNGAKVLESTETYYEGKLLVAYQKKEIETAGLSDNLYAELLKISGVKAVVFFKEKEDVVDVGFRAKKDSGLDVGEIASLIGGGGHKLASGASLKLPLDECKEKVLALFTSIL